VRRINPIHILIALNVLLLLFRDILLPEEISAAIAEHVETMLVALGPLGYVGIVAAYVICGFFFVPLLIPLNILGGALYGAAIGTGVALAGITLSSVASTVSVRYVFTGMQQTIDRRPGLKRLVTSADRHRNLVIIMVRFAVIVPYLFQNIALAATGSSITRLTVLTAISAIPGAAIYSFLGAGLVQSEDVTQMLWFLVVPVALMLGLTGAMAYFRNRFGGPEQ